MGASETVQGIVLRYANYREADRILTLFTREHGKLEAAARGCRRINSRLLSATQTFCYGEYVLNERNQRLSVQQCDLREAFFDLRNDLNKLSAATAMLALCEEGSLHGQPDEALFLLLLHSLTNMCYGENDPMDLLCYFLIHFLALEGYQVALDSCVNCGKALQSSSHFDIRAGSVCDDCANASCVQMPPLAHKAMRRMLLLPNEQMGKVVLPEAVRDALRRTLVPYAQWKLEKRFRPLEFMLSLKREG